MGLFKTHRVNEGMHIEGNGESIDWIVRARGGVDVNRMDAEIEVRGVPGINTIHLTWSDRPVWLASGLRVGIKNKGTRRYRGYRVTFIYLADRCYSLSARKYPISS